MFPCKYELPGMKENSDGIPNIKHNTLSFWREEELD